MQTFLTILTPTDGRNATKTLIINDTGHIQKISPAMAKYFSVARCGVNTIDGLVDLLVTLASATHSFVIRGEPIDSNRKSVRRLKYSVEDYPATFKSSVQGERWVCFDFDKIPCPININPVTNPHHAAQYLCYLLPHEFHDVTFFAQWSSGAGLDQWQTLSAHLWFMLDQPMADDDLKLWAEHCGAPIDTRLFNAVQPHFTAYPIILALNGEDPCPSRHGLLRGTRDTVILTRQSIAA